MSREAAITGARYRLVFSQNGTVRCPVELIDIETDRAVGHDRLDPQSATARKRFASSLDITDPERRGEIDELLLQLASEVQAFRQESPEVPAGTLLSDAELAEHFVAEHGDHLRYTATENKWRRFDGAIWGYDRTLAIYDDIRRFSRREAAGAETFAEKRRISSKVTIANVEFLVRSHREIAAVPDQWDADDFLLATPGGVLDLRTQLLRPARSTDYCTCVTAVTPDATAACPRWLEFLKWATAGDEAMVSYLRRLMGYSLTGDTREHSLAFVYGVGGNGKSVTLETWEGILNDHATTAPVSTFTASRVERHPTEVAMLRGRRLVTVRETEQGRHWAEARIKEMTGGDKVTARFMRGDFFEFKPKFKLVIAGNHRPHFTNIDEAIIRRLHLVPFTATIPAGKKDTELAAKLRHEWPAILQWMLDGCAEWLEMGGLRPPASVVTATSEYLETEDPFAEFVAEVCELAPGAVATSAELNGAWAAWASRNRVEPGDYRDLAERLARHGVQRKRIGMKSVRGFGGIRLKLQDGGHDATDSN